LLANRCLWLSLLRLWDGARPIVQWRGRRLDADDHNLFVFWLWEIPLAYVLGVKFGLGPRGVFIAMTVAFSTLALVSAAVFRRGRWKTRMV
jgi:hypothetical protein